MLAGIVVLSVLLLAALGWVLVLNSRLRAAVASGRAAEERATALDGELAEARTAAAADADRAAAATTRADAAEQRARTEGVRAETAEQRAEAEAARARAAEERASSERDRAEGERARAEDERVRAEAERRRAEGADVAANEAGDRARFAEDRLAQVRRTLDPEGLWVLERRRLARLWRDWVSVWLDEECPLPVVAGADAVRMGIEIMTSASREECGVPIDLRWDDAEGPLGAEVSTELALVVLRAAEELVATARRTNGGELAVAAIDADLVLTLTTEPDQIVPTDLVGPSSSVGWAVEVGPSSLTIRLPGVLPGDQAAVAPEPTI